MSVQAPRACYVHVPFCARVCPYCDFAVVAGRNRDAERYCAAVEREIRADSPARPLEAVFIGGGTPSSVSPRLIGRILGALAERHGMASDVEISLESNPEDLGAHAVRDLAGTGVTRLSIGAQSLDPVVLDALGRVHEPDDVLRAVDAALDLMHSVNVDLIFGHPAESAASWQETLARVVAAGPHHVSTYMLTVERGTALSRAIAGGAPAPDEDVQADRFEMAVRVLDAAGYGHYEVSNHAQPGHECRYNLDVWANRSYLAYGLGAHGYRDGVRFRNVRALDAYLSRVEAGDSPRQGEERMSEWDVELERLMLGLRLRTGVAAGQGGRAFLASDAGRRFVAMGIVSHEAGVLRVERPLLTDAVIREVVALPRVSGP